MQIDNVFKWSTFLNEQHTIFSVESQLIELIRQWNKQLDRCYVVFFSSLHSIDFLSSIVLLHWVVMIHKYQEKVRVCDGYFFSRSLVLLGCIRVRVLNANNTQPQWKKNTAIFVSSSDISSWIHRMVEPKEIAMRKENKYSKAEKKYMYKPSLSVIVVLILYRARFWFRGDVNGGDLNERERKKNNNTELTKNGNILFGCLGRCCVCCCCFFIAPR